MRDKIEKTMREDGGGATGAALMLPSFLYGLGVRGRLLLYGLNILKAEKLPCKVISVGNITVGGTGKTPVAIFIARYLKERGKRVVILSRGYKGNAKGVNIVSDGKTVLLGPEAAGDEPYLMASLLKGVPVVVSPDRVQGGLLAIEKFAPEFIILDDGFQHIRLQRDCNILLVDGKEGFGNGHLLPRGILREPIGGISRAGFAMSKGELKDEAKKILEALKIPMLSFELRPKSLYDIKNGRDKGLGFLKGQNVLAFTGLANPASFFRTAENLGAVIIKKITYPDHHPYAKSDLEIIKMEAKNNPIITTEKDAVKLKRLPLDGLSIYALGIEAVPDDLKTFEDLLSKNLKEAV